MPRMKKRKNISSYFPLLFSYLLFFVTLCNSSLAGGMLPDTGQTKCYNDTTEIPCPAPGEPFFGQDGNYQGPQPVYEVSNDGLVVTDLNTGLMWQQSDDGLTRNWVAADSYCEALSLHDHSDWRLPLIQELDTLVDYGRYGPDINSAFSCRNSNYWSGSMTVSGAGDAWWYVNFNYGYVGNQGNPYVGYVRCVRGGL